MKKLFGSRQFYHAALVIALPIMIQNGITNFVGLLDNIMVGRIGTEEMSGVAIVNQLLFVYNLMIFGSISGAGIFCAQFFGKGDIKGVQYAFRYKLLSCALLTALGIILFHFFDQTLITLYLHNADTGTDLEQTLYYAQKYLRLMLLGLPPFALEQVYASTLREGGKTTPPMVAGIVAVLLNTCLNYLLIFGSFGAPKLGVSGAAIATIISRYVQCAIVIGWTHKNSETNPFADEVYKHFEIPAQLAKQITIKGTPLLLNETLWAAGMATLLQCYSYKGLSVVAAMNISNTVSNLFNVVFFAFSSSIAIMLGQMLGANRTQEAKERAVHLISFSVVLALIVGTIMALIAPLFPNIYNTTDEIRALAKQFILIAACCMPLFSFLNATYFTLRSGGKTLITFLFDSCFVWALSVPLAYVLSRHTALPIGVIYLSCQLLDGIKCVVGYLLVKKGIWIQNIVKESG